ncbi:MAG TPA: hypothetical protein VFS88_09735 [Micavibrio sp.]|nr:hypothetical protein [Micavibrio sp.]
MPVSVEEIIYTYCQGLLNPHPDYYEGRGNNLRDLNSNILEMVYKGIHQEIGAAAAKSFVNMVKDMKNTNAKGFLDDLYRLERKEWRYSQPVMKVRAKEGVWQVPDGEGEVKPAPQPVVRRVAEVLNAFRKHAPVVGHDKRVTEDFLAAHKAEIEASGLSGSYGGAFSQ